jgi:hypothetical protein
MVDQTIHRRGDEGRQWVGPRSSIAIDRMTAIGAERKLSCRMLYFGFVPIPDFRSMPREWRGCAASNRPIIN